VVLATDNTLEHEFRQMLQIDGVAFYESRLPNAKEINPATLAAMEQEIPRATDLILPGVPLDVVAYCCTSGTIVIGEEKVFARIREARPKVACTTPITAAIAGLKALGARRIALLTPYVDEVNQMFRRFIEARDLEVPVMGSFNHEDDNEVARISPASVRAAALELGRYPQVDAVFVSCTSLRLASFADSLELDLGKPVTSSNHALAWHCLRLAGYKPPVPGLGQLFRV
jgi:maleate isomerase